MSGSGASSVEDIGIGKANLVVRLPAERLYAFDGRSREVFVPDPMSESCQALAPVRTECASGDFSNRPAGRRDMEQIGVVGPAIHAVADIPATPQRS
jgi:hypothetical protein